MCSLAAGQSCNKSRLDTLALRLRLSPNLPILQNKYTELNIKSQVLILQLIYNDLTISNQFCSKNVKVHLRESV